MSDVPKIPKHFVKVPRELILQTDLPEHRISAYLYLAYNQTWDSTCHYSPIYMISWSGYKPKWDRSAKRNNVYLKFKSTMEWLYKQNYLSEYDETKFVQNTFQTSHINLDKMNPENNFAILYDFEIEEIMNYQSSYKPLNKSILLLVLAYIRVRTNIRFTSISGYSQKTKKSDPEYFFAFIEDIAEEIGLGWRMVSKAIETLEVLGLVKTQKLANYKNENGWVNGKTVFVCPYKITYEEDGFHIHSGKYYKWEDEMKYGIAKMLNGIND